MSLLIFEKPAWRANNVQSHKGHDRLAPVPQAAKRDLCPLAKLCNSVLVYHWANVFACNYYVIDIAMLVVRRWWRATMVNVQP